MDGITVEREKLIDLVSNLPDESLLELASFLDDLCFKPGLPKIPTPNTNGFLSSIVGIGNSGQQDIAERDEEILRNEILPVYGWNLKSPHPQ